MTIKETVDKVKRAVKPKEPRPPKEPKVVGDGPQPGETVKGCLYG